MKDSVIRRLLLIVCLMGLVPLVASAFLAQATFTWLVFVLVTLPTLGLTLWTLYYIKQRMIIPLRMLVEKADTISAGDLAQPIVYDKEDEIGAFVTSFDRMRQSLHEQKQMQQAFERDRKHFIHGISHDLKTPIASISAHVEALQDQIAETPEEEQRYLRIIAGKLELLTELSNQLSLSYTTPQTLQLRLQEVDCYEWATAFFNRLQSECEVRGIKPTCKLDIAPSDPALVSMDYYQLERALQNILSNAYRYTKRLLHVSVKVKQQERLFSIRIANDGVRLSEDKAEKIFERFYTEEQLDTQGHLGLGLYIARTIVVSMKGSLRAKVGADRIAFELVLPLI